MSEPFLAEIRIMGFNFAPRGWAFCDGQILPINQNQSLYSLLGTTYGGDGRTSFALPDIRGRVPVHVGNDGAGGMTYSEGQKTGEETHTLSVNELANHSHVMQGTSNIANQAVPNNTLLAATNNGKPYSSSSSGEMGSGMVAHVGGSQAHENMQPTTVLNFCIALQGLFPSRN